MRKKPLEPPKTRKEVAPPNTFDKVVSLHDGSTITYKVTRSIDDETGSNEWNLEKVAETAPKFKNREEEDVTPD